MNVVHSASSSRRSLTTTTRTTTSTTEGTPSTRRLYHDKSGEDHHQQRLNFYTESPTVELSIDDFEVYALKRLKVLKKIEQLKMMRVSQETYVKTLTTVTTDQGLFKDAQLDEISHFILRLCYCQSEELRRWFLQHELLLFQFRLRRMDANTLATAVRAHCAVKPIDEATKQQHAAALQQLVVNPTEFAKATFYAVPFTAVLDLVAQRQCYLRAGQAYLVHARVESLLTSKFRAHLSRTLASMGNAHPHVLGGNGNASGHYSSPEASRLVPLVTNLSKCMVTAEPGSEQHMLLANGGGGGGASALTATNVTQHTPYMPLCMRQLQSGLQKDKKLKHWGRLQYGLFLKGAGLSMEDALAFFQRQFSSLTGEQFTKEYAYNIRHMYGREGKRATYTPYSCNRITSGNAPSSSGEHHGCPYKHYDTQHLGQLLQKLQVGTAADRSEILNLTKTHNYQLACQKHFQVMHPNAASRSDVPLDNVGNHPNAWFRASVAYHKNPHSDHGSSSNSKVKTEAVVTPEK